MTDAIVVEGLTELIRAFDKADRGLGREVRSALGDAGEVVRVSAQQRASSQIRNIGEIWPRMRLGVTTSEAYVVPKTRRAPGHGPKYGPPWNRPNLGLLLIDRALDPALEANIHRVEHDLEDALDNLNQNAGLVSSLHNLGA